MQRRKFVKTLAAAAVAAQALPQAGEAMEDQLARLSADLNEPAIGGKKWQRVRSEFTLNQGITHFNTGSVGAVPRVVIDTVCQYMRQDQIDPYSKAFESAPSVGPNLVREKAAEFLGVDVDEVTVTRNTTEGMNQVATGLHLNRGDEVLTTNHEHGGGMICWQYLAKHHGVKIRYMKMPNPVVDKAEILELIEENITPRTRVCSFSHIDTITGLQMPMADIAKITRAKDILLVCDGAQGPGMLDVNLRALGVDTYASSSHKWLLAPKGSGLLYIRREVQDRIQPVMFFHTGGTGKGLSAYGAASGSRNVPHILGHGVAIDFHNAIGRTNVEARCRALSNLVRQRLHEIPALKLLTPEEPELSSGMVSFGLDPAKGNNGEICARFRAEHNIILKTVQGTYAYVPAEDFTVARPNYNAIRISTHIFNSKDEIEKMAELMKKMLA